MKFMWAKCQIWRIQMIAKVWFMGLRLRENIAGTTLLFLTPYSFGVMISSLHLETLVPIIAV